MTDWLTISAQDAIQTLRTIPVFAIETPDGVWGEVSAIDDLLEQGLLVPAYRIRFASGHVRVTTGGGIFRVEHGVGRGNDRGHDAT